MLHSSFPQGFFFVKRKKTDLLQACVDQLKTIIPLQSPAQAPGQFLLDVPLVLIDRFLRYGNAIGGTLVDSPLGRIVFLLIPMHGGSVCDDMPNLMQQRES